MIENVVRKGRELGLLALLTVGCTSPVIPYSQRQDHNLVRLLQEIDADTPFLTQEAISSTAISNLWRIGDDELPDYKPIQFTLPNGTIEDTLYRQGDSTAPLLIFTGGFFSDVHAYALYHFTSIMREEVVQNYNVLLLNHPSSAPFYCANGEVSWGGIEEGYMIIEIAKQMKERFPASSVHAIGISMGGNGVLHAAYRGRGVLDSAMVFSAVTDLLEVPGNTLRGLRDKSEFGPSFFSITGWLNEVGMGKLYNGFEKVRKEYQQCKGKPFTKEQIENTYLTTARYAPAERLQDYLAPYILDKVLPDKMPNSVEDYLAMSDATRIASSIHIPLTVVHAHDDAVVPENHFYRFMLAARGNPQINGIITPDGGHWGFSAAYGEEWVATLIQKHVDFWSQQGQNVRRK